MLTSRTDGAFEEETSWPLRVGRLAACAAIAHCIVVLSGCSAIGALREMHRAERALLSTAVLRPTPAATYAITLSRAYLEKAREEASEAQYGTALSYARAARSAAQVAQRTQVHGVASAASGALLLGGAAR